MDMNAVLREGKYQWVMVVQTRTEWTELQGVCHVHGTQTADQTREKVRLYCAQKLNAQPAFVTVAAFDLVGPS